MVKRESQTPTLSVIICTYQRADILKAALASLCAQTADDEEFEVLVVTNSTDHTHSVVAEYQQQQSNIHYLFDETPGLSNARNAGWRHARGRYVAYIDDDCRVPQHWVATALAIIADEAPGAFGGPIYPAYDRPRPRWFQDDFVIHRPFEEKRVLHGEAEATRIFGGNAFFRRDLLAKLGGFDPEISMVGDKISFGEDTAVLQQLVQRCPQEKIFYHPDLWLYHLVRPVTLTWRYNLPATFEGGRVQFRQKQHKISRLRSKPQLGRKLLRTAAALCFDMVRAVFARDRQAYPYLQSYLFAHTLGYVRRLGSLYAEYQAHGSPVWQFQE